LKKNRHHIPCNRACIRKRGKEGIYFKHFKLLSPTREKRHIISSYPNKIVDRCNFYKNTQPYILLHNKSNTPFTKITCVCVKLTRLYRIYFPSANPIIYPPSPVYSQNLTKLIKISYTEEENRVLLVQYFISPQCNDMW